MITISKTAAVRCGNRPSFQRACASGGGRNKKSIMRLQKFLREDANNERSPLSVHINREKKPSQPYLVASQRPLLVSDVKLSPFAFYIVPSSLRGAFPSQNQCGEWWCTCPKTSVLSGPWTWKDVRRCSQPPPHVSTHAECLEVTRLKQQ